MKPKERQGFPVTEPSREGKERLFRGIPLYEKKENEKEDYRERSEEANTDDERAVYKTHADEVYF